MRLNILLTPPGSPLTVPTGSATICPADCRVFVAEAARALAKASVWLRSLSFAIPPTSCIRRRAMAVDFTLKVPKSLTMVYWFM